MKKRIANVFKIAVTLLLFYFIFSKMNMENLWGLVRNADLQYLLIAVALMFFVTIILGVRLSLVSQVQFRIFPSLMLKVYFFNNLLPAQVGGDIYKYISLKPYNTSNNTFSMIFSDRLLGVTGLLMFSLLNIVLFPSFINDNRVYLGVGLYLAALLVILAVVFLLPEFSLEKINNKWLNKGFSVLFKVKTTTRGYYIRYFGRSILLTIFAYFLLVLVNTSTMKALNLQMNFWASFVYVPLISVAVVTFPISFNGLGVRESLFILFFGMVGYTMEESIAMAFVNLIAIWIVSIFGGILVLFSKEHIRDIRSENSIQVEI